MKEYLNQKLITNAFKKSQSGYDWEDYYFILNKFQDEKSKYVFYYRVMADLTNDIFYILKLVQTFQDSNSHDLADLNMKYLIEFLIKNNNYQKDIYLIGIDEVIINYLKNLRRVYPLNIKGIFLKNKFQKQLSEYQNILVHSLKKMPIDNNAIYLIIDLDYRDALEKFTFQDNVYTSICNWPLSRELQYFGDPIIKPLPNEVFVDCGAYNLDTSLDFIAWTQNNYSQIYAFEPFKQVYKDDLKRIKEEKFKKIQLYNLAVWKQKTRLPMLIRYSGDSTISESIINFNSHLHDFTDIEANSIDNVLKNKKVTLIKYDIEGSEAEAIEGSKNLIKLNKPRLLVSVYHLPMDIIKLSLEILQINPTYQFYLRHQSFTNNETILYCFNSD